MQANTFTSIMQQGLQSSKHIFVGVFLNIDMSLKNKVPFFCFF